MRLRKNIESCAYYFKWSFSQNSEDNIHCAEIESTPYESQGGFHWDKTRQNFFEKPKNQNKISFSSTSNIQFNIWEQFLEFKAFRSVEIDTIGIEVAQKISTLFSKSWNWTIQNTHFKIIYHIPVIPEL